MNVKKQNQKNCPDQGRCAKLQTEGFLTAPKITKYILAISLIMTLAQKVQAQSPHRLTDQANKLYAQKKFNEAIRQMFERVTTRRIDLQVFECELVERLCANGKRGRRE